MNTDASLSESSAHPLQTPTKEKLLDWLGPSLFALLISTIIRLHSWSPISTLDVLASTLALVAIATLSLSWAMGRRLSVPVDLAALLLALGVSILVSTVRSPDSLGSLPRLLLYAALLLLAIAVYLVYRDMGRISLALYCAALALLHVPFAADVALWVKDMEQPFFQDGVRVANFSNVRQFGEAGFLAAISGVALGTFEVTSGRRWMAVSLLTTCVALFGIIAMGSRGALLSWFIFVLLLCSFGTSRRRVALLGLASVSVTCGLVWWLDYSEVLPTPNIFKRQGLESGLNSFSSGRVELWIISLREILAQPFFGLGPEGYLLSGCCDRTVAQPHNFVLQILMEFGAIGFLLLLALLWRLVRRYGGWRSMTRLVLAHPNLTVLACMILSYLAYALIDGVLYHPLPLIHLSLYCGLFAAGLHHARTAEHR
jgi:O-antigen ligase